MLIEIKKKEFPRATTVAEAARNWLHGVPVDPHSLFSDFYVERPQGDTAIQELIVKLTDAASTLLPAKYFFSGQRGCGKSTALVPLAKHPDIERVYFPFHFSIKNSADINDLDYRDILFLLAAEMLTQYKGEFPENLQEWQGVLAEKRSWLQSLAAWTGLSEAELDLHLVKLKFQKEPTSRQKIREALADNSTKTLDLIKSISAFIENQEGRLPLILIDDLDKPSVDQQEEIFFHNRNTFRTFA